MKEQVAVNPATGKVVARYPAHSDVEAAKAVENAHATFLKWREVSLDQRAKLLHRLSDVLLARKDEYAKLMADEMGKPLKEGHAEVEKCALNCRYTADNGAKWLADRPIQTDAKKTYVCFEPLGAVLAIMPWNFPFWQVMRAAAPILMGGNVMLLKHASNTPGCAKALESAIVEAGFPAAAFQSLMITPEQTATLIDHPHIRAVTLTGSTPAGRAVASSAGRALKKCVLELGGSDPYIILKDADLDKAAKAVTTGRILNCGQSCIGTKRSVVVKEVREAYEQKLLTEFSKAVVGDPHNPATTMGPMSRVDARDSLHRQVAASVSMGAKCLIGGQIPAGEGAFYPPTILTHVKPGMPAYEEELFGPVAVIIEAEDEEDAIRIAADTPFGLGGAVFTQDLEKGEAIARHRIEAGTAYVNGNVRSDPRVPFGGIKDSGYGRELGDYGIMEFMNIKTVMVVG